MDAVELRPVSAADESFLIEVYASCRLEELALLSWDEMTKQNFLQMQFHAQQTHYRAYFPEASHDVILAEGVPAGQLYVDRRETEIRILDMALLPAARGRGIGSDVLQGLKKEAATVNKILSIYVESSSSSLRLFQRLGFVKAGQNGFSDLLEWRPAVK